MTDRTNGTPRGNSATSRSPSVAIATVETDAQVTSVRTSGGSSGGAGTAARVTSTLMGRQQSTIDAGTTIRTTSPDNEDNKRLAAEYHHHYRSYQHVQSQQQLVPSSARTSNSGFEQSSAGQQTYQHRHQPICIPQAVAAAVGAAAGGVSASGIMSYAALLSQMRERASETVSSSSSAALGAFTPTGYVAASSADPSRYTTQHSPPSSSFALPLPFASTPFFYQQRTAQLYHQQGQSRLHQHLQLDDPHGNRHFDFSSRQSPYSDLPKVPVRRGSSSASSTSGMSAEPPTPTRSPQQHELFLSVPRRRRPSSPGWLPRHPVVPGSPFVVPGFLYPPPPGATLSVSAAAAAAASAVLSNIAQSYRAKYPPDQSRDFTVPSSQVVVTSSGVDVGDRRAFERHIEISTPSSMATTPPSVAESGPRRTVMAGRRTAATSSTIVESSSTSSRGLIHSVNSTRHPVLHHAAPSQTSSTARSNRRVVDRPLYPAHFTVGSVIDLGGGAFKRVEELSTDDFERSAADNSDLELDMSTVIHMEHDHERQTVILGFRVGRQQTEVSVEASLEHPFFVFHRGWSSCSPDRTLRRYGLRCYRLSVGDCCVSLTNRRRRPDDPASSTRHLSRSQPGIGYRQPSSVPPRAAGDSTVCLQTATTAAVVTDVGRRCASSSTQVVDVASRTPTSVITTSGQTDRATRRRKRRHSASDATLSGTWTTDVSTSGASRRPVVSHVTEPEAEIVTSGSATITTTSGGLGMLGFLSHRPFKPDRQF